MGGRVGTLHAEEGYGFVCAVLKESLFLFLSHRAEGTLNCSYETTSSSGGSASQSELSRAAFSMDSCPGWVAARWALFVFALGSSGGGHGERVASSLESESGVQGSAAGSGLAFRKMGSVQV